MEAQVGSTTAEPAVVAKNKMTRTVLVPQSRMESIRAWHPARCMPPCPGRAVLSSHPEFQKQLRTHLDEAQRAILWKSCDEDEAIYRQYVAKGRYAEMEVEATDGDQRIDSRV